MAPQQQTDTAEARRASEIEAASVRLSQLSDKLERNGHWLLRLTLLCLVASLFLVVSPISIFAMSRRDVSAVFSFLLGLGFGVLLLVADYERQKRQGELLFQELSDELQWYVRFDEASHSGVAEHRPSLGVRLSLRKFASSADLPIVPGRYGPAAYAGVTLVFLVVPVLLWYASKG